jgi:hypothetical protein
MIKKSQIALIHVAKSKLGLTEEEYRTILRVHGGVETSVDLDEWGLEKVMRLLRDLGFRYKKKARRPDLAILASEGQRKIIYHLMEDLGWIPSRLYGFITKMTGEKTPEELKKEEASKVIEGLKAMRDRAVQWN